MVLLCALVMSAFAHQASPAVAQPTGIDMRAYAAQYTLPDGTLPVLCDWQSGDSQNSTSLCEFCLIAASAHLTPIEASVFAAYQTVSIATGKRPDPAMGSRHLYRLNAPLRGPPLA